MKTLYHNESKSYSSETVEHNGKKFKISTENGNGYSRTKIELYTDNGLATIANGGDISGIIKVSYLDSGYERLTGSLRNIQLAKKYIEMIY